MAQKLRLVDPDDRYTIGPRIRELRMGCNMTQPQVVAQMQLYGCSTSRETLAKIESSRANLSFKELRALKQIFGVDYNAFFDHFD